MITIADIDRRINQALARFRFSVERVTGLVFGDHGVTGQGEGGDDLDMELGGLDGFQSRPLDGGEGVVVKRDARGATSILVGYRVRQHEGALQKGERSISDDQGQRVTIRREATEVYSGGAKVTLNRATGSINVDTAPGQSLIFNGGATPIARKGDEVRVTLPAGSVVVAVVGGVATMNPFDIILVGTITSGHAFFQVP